MPIALLGDILREAQSGKYGVPYCESWNLESAQAVVDAAEKLNSPAIVGFNGGFLQHPSRQRPENSPGTRECGWRSNRRVSPSRFC